MAPVRDALRALLRQGNAAANPDFLAQAVALEVATFKGSELSERITGQIRDAV